jgi:amino acid transporter
MADIESDRGSRPALKRELGLLEVTLSGIGIILGAGIYVLIGQGAALAGNALWISFIISAIIALMTCLSYAELSSLFPRAGAEYDYVANAFNTHLAFVIGFLIVLSGVLAASTVALGFGGYLMSLVTIPARISAFLLIIVLMLILSYGIKETAWVIIISTFIEIAGLAVIIFIGIPFLGTVDYFDIPHGVSGLLAASALIFFAYQGFESMVKFSEETKRPETTIPKALVIALLISSVIYVLVALCAVSLLNWQELSVSQAPFSDIISTQYGSGAVIAISIIALFATGNTVLLSLFASSRILYGMAGSLALPRLLAVVHPQKKTPWIAILVCALIAIVFLLPGDIAFVANLTNFTLFLTFIVINASVIVLRYRLPGIKRPFRVPLSIGKFPLIPFFGLLSSVFLLFEQDVVVLILGACLTIIGIFLSFLKINDEK